MRQTRQGAVVAGLVLGLCGTGWAEPFYLVTGVDAGRWPDTARAVTPVPGPGFAGTFHDGDRLAGNVPQGPMVTFVGDGTPFFDPNEFGSMSFMYRRGSVPIGGGSRVPLQGVDFLGGPLLDLDGDLTNGVRKLIPVLGAGPVIVPGEISLVDLGVDVAGGAITLHALDVTGTNEAGPGIDAGVATTLNTIAGTSTNGVPGTAINASIDTRVGTLTPFVGTSGLLAGVYRVEDLGFEFWQDTVLVNSPTATTLGTFQFLGTFRGYVIERGEDDLFPSLAAEDLGTTMWPTVNTSGLGLVLETANMLAGGSATISEGPAGDLFTATNNGGGAATSLGPYFNSVIVPNLHPLAERFVYLESAGFGMNNSGDPIYTDTVSYDVVLIAQSAPTVNADCDADGDVDLADHACLQRCMGAGSTDCLVFDLDLDETVTLADYAAMAQRFTGPVSAR